MSCAVLCQGSIALQLPVHSMTHGDTDGIEEKGTLQLHDCGKRVRWSHTHVQYQKNVAGIDCNRCIVLVRSADACGCNCRRLAMDRGAGVAQGEEASINPPGIGDELPASMPISRLPVGLLWCRMTHTLQIEHLVPSSTIQTAGSADAAFSIVLARRPLCPKMPAAIARASRAGKGPSPPGPHPLEHSQGHTRRHHSRCPTWKHAGAFVGLVLLSLRLAQPEKGFPVRPTPLRPTRARPRRCHVHPRQLVCARPVRTEHRVLPRSHPPCAHWPRDGDPPTDRLPG